MQQQDEDIVHHPPTIFDSTLRAEQELTFDVRI